MRITYITAGAAGMYCGSCMHDNTLVAELQAQGHDALLVPTYTPIRTDETDVSQRRVFFGGINVYLQQKYAFFRRTPWFLDRLLDFPPLLRWVSRFAVKTQADELGDLAVSMLKGEHGYQRKEIEKLVAWLKHDVRPEIINLTNVLLSGMADELRRELGVPVLGTLQGDDIFLEALPERHRASCIELISKNCSRMDGFISTSNYYADFMSDYLRIPRERITVVYPGLNLKGYTPRTASRNGAPFTIGYFARICPEKGLHNLATAFRLLKQMPELPPIRLRVSGWLGDNDRAYFDEIQRQLGEVKLTDQFEHVNAPDHASKVDFFKGIDVLSVPTTYLEPKGLYVLEALANGIPVVQPRHGSFPELIESTGGGLLVEPGNPLDLVRALRELIEDPARCSQMGEKGRDAVQARFHAGEMARQTLDVYRKYL